MPPLRCLAQRSTRANRAAFWPRSPPPGKRAAGAPHPKRSRRLARLQASSSDRRAPGEKWPLNFSDLLILQIGNRSRGGLGKKVFPGRKIFSKSKARKTREETPTYLHGSWEHVGKKPRVFRCLLVEIAFFLCPAFAIMTGALKHLFTEPPSTGYRYSSMAGLAMFDQKINRSSHAHQRRLQNLF